MKNCILSLTSYAGFLSSMKLFEMMSLYFVLLVLCSLECFCLLAFTSSSDFFCNIDIHFLCLFQEEGEEAEAVIQQMLREGVLVVGARAGDIIRILQTIPDPEATVMFSMVHDRKMS